MSKRLYAKCSQGTVLSIDSVEGAHTLDDSKAVSAISPCHYATKVDPVQVSMSIYCQRNQIGTVPAAKSPVVRFVGVFSFIAKACIRLTKMFRVQRVFEQVSCLW